MKIVLYLFIGLVVGCASGMLGIGGGVLLIPALTWLCGMDLEEAKGTSLAVLVVPVVLPAVLYYHDKGKLNFEAAVWIGALFAVGSFLGAWMVKYVSAENLRLAFGLLMIYIAVRFILSSDSEVRVAATGLIATALAWLSYLGLKWLGRRHLPPNLGEQIRLAKQQDPGDLDYYI